MADTPAPELKPAPEPNPPPAAPPPVNQPQKRSRGRKWLRRVVLAGLAAIILAPLLLFGVRVYFQTTGKSALAAETARLDAEDPGWRFDDLMAARAKAAPPEAENSAVIVREVRARIPAEWREWQKQRTVLPDDAELAPINRWQELTELTRDAELAFATRPSRDLALKLRDHPRGYHVVTVGDGPFIESLEETQGVREVANLIKTDAILAAQARDPARGIRASHALLNAARSIGDEPGIVSALVRYACGGVSAEAAMRVLALTDPLDVWTDMVALQRAIEAELAEPILPNAFRGERAVGDRFLARLEDGTLGAEDLARAAGIKTEIAGRLFFAYRRAFLPEDRRRFLRLTSDLVEGARGPLYDALGTSKRVEDDLRASRDPRYPYHGILVPASRKPIEASCRHRAELLSVAALIACERFRLANRRWPNSLEELPKDHLAAIPVDPCTGEPMKYARLADGITVYSTGAGLDLDRNKKRLTNPLGGTEIGWRLYDPAERGLAPLPRAPKPDDAAKP
jgi:hypothetical protein